MDDTKINFCVLVSYDKNYERMASYTVDLNIKKYCELHGYDLHINYQEKFSNGKPAQWQKILAARELLETNKYDWIFFLDTDCLIMNPNIKLESFIDDKCSFILPKHNIEPIDTPIELEGLNNIITSQFFVKNDEFGKDILDEIWLASDNHKIDKFDHEGRQIRIIINSGKFNNRIGVVEEKRLNRFWYVNNPFMYFAFKGINDNVWQEGDFIVHVTAYSTEDRIKILSDLNYFSGLNYKK
jgi:hypothetical protein